MVGTRLLEHKLFARTVQLKLRYSDFSTFTRAHTLDHATHLDIDLIEHSRALFRANWTKKPVRLLGVHAGNLQFAEGQMGLLDQEKSGRWDKALQAVDRIRGRYGSGSVGIASALGGRFRERVHENPAGLPGKEPGERDEG
jgi:DNA polymerase-4